MVSLPQQKRLFIGLGFLGLAVCCCAILGVVLAFTDPFHLDVGGKILAFIRPTSTPIPTPPPTPKPTTDPCLQKQGQLIIGCPAPEFDLTTFDGQVLSLAKLRGKVVVVNFWASWAVPCRADVVNLQAAWKDYLERSDIVFMGLAWVDTDQEAREFIREFALTYPNGLDIGSRISQAYHITGVPETYIVDKNGLLVYIKSGPYQSVVEIKVVIDPLLRP